MHWQHKLALSLFTAALSTTAIAAAQITFYEGAGFRGRAFSADKHVKDFRRSSFNDRASSVVVERGRWQVCEDVNFRGHCTVLRKGSYESLSAMGMNNRISSMRPVSRRDERYESDAPEPIAMPAYEYRRRANERIYQVPVTSAVAVMGPPEERCWVERQQVKESDRRDSNVGGAIVGAIIGGVLGHQVGEGRGKDAATVGGVAAGAVIGSRVGRGTDNRESRDVRRCDSVVSGTPAYWDVSYSFRGVPHRLQMSEEPGRTIAVNYKGDPRQ